MKKFSAFLAATAILFVGSLITPNSAEAVPSFARQVGVPCFACHYQHMPALNAFGREFKLGGYTQSAQELIEDDGLSLPPVANVSFILKYQYVKTDTPNMPGTGEESIGTDRGALVMPDEAALWMGGRVAENWGFVTEFPGPAAVLKLVYSKDFGGVQGGVVFYNNDGHGPGASMEMWNTGAVKNHRRFEVRDGSYASSVLGGVGMGDASGISVFGGTGLFFVNVGMWAPAPEGGDTGTELATYYRLAVTPRVSENIDLMVGLQGSSGTVKTGNDNETAAGVDDLGAPFAAVDGADTLDTVTVGSLRIDTQVQTDIGGMSFEFTGEYQINANDKDSLWNRSTVAGGGGEDEKGMTFTGSLGLTPMAGVKAAFASYENINGMKADADLTVTTLGAWYHFAQNVLLDVEFLTYGGDTETVGSPDSKMMLMIQAGI